MFRLLLKLCEDRRALIPYTEFDDEHEWGDSRTFRRLKDELNRLWEMHTKTPLFKVVDIDGNEVDRGDRFLILLDNNLQIFRKERYAVFPAYMEFMRIMGGTILEDELKPIYEKITLDLDRSDKSFLKRMEKKFFYFGRGMKDYRSRREILDQVYSALIREQKLAVELEKDGERKEHILRPLTLMLFNSGLYLVAIFDDSEEIAGPIFHFRIESFFSATAIKNTSFQFPPTYDPAKKYGGQFGIIHGNSHFVVELEFSSDPLVRRYVRERQWTNSDLYAEGANGTLCLRMEVSDLTEIQSWVLSFGSNCRVIGPDILRNYIRDEIKKMHGHYVFSSVI